MITKLLEASKANAENAADPAKPVIRWSVKDLPVYLGVVVMAVSELIAAGVIANDSPFAKTFAHVVAALTALGILGARAYRENNANTVAGRIAETKIAAEAAINAGPKS